jgi:hypothetical protein
MQLINITGIEGYLPFRLNCAGESFSVFGDNNYESAMLSFFHIDMQVNNDID